MADQMEISLGHGFFRCDGTTAGDVSARQHIENGYLVLTLTADTSRVCYLRLRWGGEKAEKRQSAGRRVGTELRRFGLAAFGREPLHALGVCGVKRYGQHR